MKLIVGLGNPGPEYERTRHNVGFLVVDRLARRFVDPATGGGIAKARFSGLLLEARVQGERVFLLKPTVFMNRSGQSILEALQFYKIDPVTDLLVLRRRHRIASWCDSFAQRRRCGRTQWIERHSFTTGQPIVCSLPNRNRFTRTYSTKGLCTWSFHKRTAGHDRTSTRRRPHVPQSTGWSMALKTR